MLALAERDIRCTHDLHRGHLQSIAGFHREANHSMLPRRTFSSASLLLSGHSKWSKIKHGKGVEDAKRSQINSKASKDITRAARLGGSLEPALNSALAAALKQARKYDVPGATIQRALNRASSQKGSSNLQSVLYEALVDGKVALLIECLTDNTNRANHNIRNIINGGGCVQTSNSLIIRLQHLSVEG